MAWELLGSTTLGSSGDVITVDGLTEKNFLTVQIFSIDDGNQNPEITFNNDTSASYAYRTRLNFGNTTATSQNNLYLLADDNGNKNIVLFISNILNEEKLILGRTVFGETGAANIPNNTTYFGKWIESDQITRMDLTNAFAGDFNAGSQLIIWGSD